MYGCPVVGTPSAGEHVKHDVSVWDRPVAVQHAPAEPAKVRVAVLVPRDQLPVKLQVRRQCLGELRKKSAADFLTSHTT